MTITSAVPLVIDALVTQLPAVMPAGTTVYDCFPVTDNPGSYLAVGVDDPDSEEMANAAESRHARATFGTSRDESGSIRCAAVAWNGDGDMKAARDSVFAMCSAVSDLLLADKTLGITAVNMQQTLYGTEQPLRQAQTTDGAVAYVLFEIYFQALL